MNRKDLKRKRNNAIRTLRELGMTDAEIAAELGVDSLEPEQKSEIVDAEIVDLSTDAAMDRNEPPIHLPAVIPQPKRTDNQADSIKYTQWSEEWWQHAKPGVRQRRCKAHRKDGGQCLKAAINGATVCRYHGGAARHVKAAARARLENATDLMAKQLLRMAVDDNVADAVKLSAIKDALDRAGLKAPNEVVLSPGAQTGFDDVFTDIVAGPRYEPESFEPQAEAGSYSLDSASLAEQGEPKPPTQPQPAEPCPDGYDTTAGSGSYADLADAPRCSHQRGRERGPRGYSAPIAGYDAMRIANEMRALPPGRID